MWELSVILRSRSPLAVLPIAAPLAFHSTQAVPVALYDSCARRSLPRESAMKANLAQGREILEIEMLSRPVCFWSCRNNPSLRHLS